MRTIIIIGLSCLLHSAFAQKDSIPQGSSSFGVGFSFLQDEAIFWNSIHTHGDKYIYDSGRLMIYGDTIKLIRSLAKRYDSVTRRFDSLRVMAGKAIMDATDFQKPFETRKASIVAFYHYAYGYPKTKKKHKK